MFLPPGPMSAPIFSGLILMVSMRGAYLLISLRGSARVLAISARMCMRATRAFSIVSAMSACGRPLQLQVELEAGDALFRAGDLAIHVAVMVFPADDVGEQLVLGNLLAGVVFGADADADAGHGTDHRNAGVHAAPACRRKRSPSRWSRWIP